jgi:hypothetical protein
VKLVKEAWKVSFARVEMNRKAVLHRGWGPKALNMNVLKNPEIMATVPNVSKDLMGRSQGLNSKMPATELNINEGLAGTLVNRIVLESNKYAAERGSCISEITRKQKETALKNWKTMRSDVLLVYLQALRNLVLAWIFLNASDIARK